MLLTKITDALNCFVLVSYNFPSMEDVARNFCFFSKEIRYGKTKLGLVSKATSTFNLLDFDSILDCQLDRLCE